MPLDGLGRYVEKFSELHVVQNFWSCIPHTIDDPIVEEPIEFLAISLIKLDPNRRTEKNLLVRSLNGATNQQRHRTSFSGSSAGRAKSRATNVAY
jgi:hypothetical protein